MARNEHIVIRSANAMDEEALAVLAVIDGARQPLDFDGEVLVAEVGGRMRAAIDSNGASISDPFWPSYDLVSMLRVHAGQLPPRPARPRFSLRRPVLA